VQIDNFGTGYSSLSYLQHLPAEMLKIDRSFIGRMEVNRDGAELVRAVVALGRALGMQVVAEGIETAGQLSRLKELECAYGQGYLFAAPADSRAVEALLVGWSTSGNRMPRAIGEAPQPSNLALAGDVSRGRG
jgi:EAL domain-containing protein (putative c-di-GMP-specific phosphodiesterase class I)